MIRKLLVLFLALATTASGQTLSTRLRADQIKVDPSGFSYLTYTNLQTLLAAVDTNLVAIRSVAISPTAMSNTVAKATSDAVYDLVIATALATASDSLGGRACVSVPTNTVLTNAVADSSVTWTFPILSDYTWVTNAVAVSSTGLLVQATGGYSVSLTSAIFPPDGASNFVSRIVVTSGTSVITSTVPAIAASYGGPTSYGFVGEFFYPLSSGAVVRASCSYDTSSTNATDAATGGGVMMLNFSPLRNPAGTTIVAPLEGGW
jgi:hypothetical protein